MHASYNCYVCVFSTFHSFIQIILCDVLMRLKGKTLCAFFFFLKLWHNSSIKFTISGYKWHIMSDLRLKYPEKKKRASQRDERRKRNDLIAKKIFCTLFINLIYYPINMYEIADDVQEIFNQQRVVFDLLLILLIITLLLLLY